MLGIQKAVKSCSDPGTLQLNKRDFKIKYVFDLIPRRAGKDEFKYNIFKFTDYAPTAFMNIRKQFGITSNSYLKSIGAK